MMSMRMKKKRNGMKMKKIPKPWGEEIVHIDEPEYVMKELRIKSGMHTSLHYHTQKKETLYISQGVAKVESSSGGCFLNKGEIITIPIGAVHRITAYKGDLVIIEVSTQPKDDSVRIKP